MSKKIIKLRTTGKYPCQYDDLIDENNLTRATFYTLEEIKKDLSSSKEGITKGTDGVYDIVLELEELTIKDVRKALEMLGKFCNFEFVLI